MFNRLKIASKLSIGFGAILLILCGISALATVSLVRSKAAIEKITKLKGDEALEQRVEKRLYEARMHYWIAIGSGDQKDWSQSDEVFAAADQLMDELAADTAEADRNAKAQDMSKLVKGYRKLSNRLNAAQQKNGTLSYDEIKAGGDDGTKFENAMTKLGEELASDYRNAAEATVAQAKEWASFVEILIIGAGVAGVAFGALLSLAVTRSIRPPIVKPDPGDESLRGGRSDGVDPERRAAGTKSARWLKAVLVFQDAAVENARLESEAGGIARTPTRARRNEQAQREAIAHERAIVAEFDRLRPVETGGQGPAYRCRPDIPEAYRKLQADFNAAIGQLEAAMASVAAQRRTRSTPGRGKSPRRPTICRGAPSSRRRASRRPPRRSTKSPRR